MVVPLPGGERMRGIYKFGGVTDVRRRRERFRSLEIRRAHRRREWLVGFRRHRR